jgi:hypothetical protein
MQALPGRALPRIPKRAMNEINDVDELLKVDGTTAEQSVLVFKTLAPDAMDCANAALRVFAAAAGWVIEYEQNHPEGEKFNALADELGIPGQELYAIVQGTPTEGEDPRIAAARGIDKSVALALAQRTLLQLCWRSYRWGITDLRRLKLTSAAGHLRVGVEAAALMLLFMEQNEYAFRWLDPKDNKIKFFNETKHLVREILKDRRLAQAYEYGSAVAQHARFASAARGIRLQRGDIQVLDQEFEPQDPVTFHLALAYYLRMQGRIFGLLTEVFDGLARDGTFHNELAGFFKLDEKVWWVLERKYGKEIKEFYVDE